MIEVKSSNTFRGYNMPIQKISSSSKNEEWAKSCVDAIIGMANSTMRNGRNSRQNKQINYDLYNSKFDEDDWNYVTKPYGLNEKYQTATKMQNYNLIRPNIEVLKGEEIKRPFNFFAKATNGGAVSAKEQRKKELILQNLRSRLYQELGIEPEEDEEGNVMELPDIEKYINSEFSDPREVTANQLLRYLLHQEVLEMKFNQGWEHALISAEEYYYVGIVSGEPICRVVNPLDFEHDMNGDIKFIEDAQWCKETRYMNVSSILDTYGEYLTDVDLDRLDNGDLSYSNQYGMQPGFAYSLDDIKAQSLNNDYREQGIVVVNVCWKSWKKIGFLRYIDEVGEQEQMVDDTFKLTAEMKAYGASIEWRWINEVWEGTRIGNDIYVNIRPLVNQTRSMSNPSECKLPYTGYIYNNTNSVATSILDLIKPHQYTYNILWWRFEQELAKSKGKAMVMDMAQMPKTQGFDVEQWIYYFDNLGVAFINSMEEGREGDQSTVAKFNQFQALDRTVSADVRIYLEAMTKIESMVDNIVGISQQRRAQTSPSESATANQNSIIQSSHMTEPYFYFHNILKGQVLTKLLECCKFAYEDGKKINHIVDEIYTETITVDGEKFIDSDYGVFVTNSSKDNEIKQKVEGLFQVALQQEKLQLSDLIKGMQSDSVTEMSAIIATGEQKFFDEQAKNQQADRDNQKQINDDNIAAQERKDQREDTNKELDRQNKIQIATIGTMRGKDGPSDLNGNAVADSSEYAKLLLEQDKTTKASQLEQAKLAAQANKDYEANERAKEKSQVELFKQQREDEKFSREQDQQDALNRSKVEADIHKSKLEEQKLLADIAKMRQDSKDKELDRRFKLKELDAKMTLEKFKANEKMKQDRLKAQADIKMKAQKTKADIAAKKQGIKTKSKSK